LAFCDIFETINGTGPAYSEGLATRFNITVALDAFLIGISETNPDTFATVQPPETEDADSLAWEYQFCNEFGAFSCLFLCGFVALTDRICM
jgi:hypothetical protein